MNQNVRVLTVRLDFVVRSSSLFVMLIHKKGKTEQLHSVTNGYRTVSRCKIFRRIEVEIFNVTSGKLGTVFQAERNWELTPKGFTNEHIIFDLLLFLL